MGRHLIYVRGMAAKQLVALYGLNAAFVCKVECQY